MTLRARVAACVCVVLQRPLGDACHSADASTWRVRIPSVVARKCCLGGRKEELNRLCPVTTLRSAVNSVKSTADTAVIIVADSMTVVHTAVHGLPDGVCATIVSEQQPAGALSAEQPRPGHSLFGCPGGFWSYACRATPPCLAPWCMTSVTPCLVCRCLGGAVAVDDVSPDTLHDVNRRLLHTSQLLNQQLVNAGVRCIIHVPDGADVEAKGAIDQQRFQSVVPRLPGPGVSSI